MEETTHTTATVVVEETGVYQVSIFPLREGTGILGSNVEYTEQITIGPGKHALRDFTIVEPPSSTLIYLTMVAEPAEG